MFFTAADLLIKTLGDSNCDDVYLKKGDHVKVSFGLYDHHGIYSGEGTVIQRNSNGISEVSIEEFSEGHKIEVVHHEDRLYKRKKVVARARSHIGEKEYSLLFKNCEHFANEMISGESRSEQVDNCVSRFTSPVSPVIVKGIKKNFDDIQSECFDSMISPAIFSISPSLSIISALSRFIR